MPNAGRPDGKPAAEKRWRTCPALLSLVIILHFANRS